MHRELRIFTFQASILKIFAFALALVYFVRVFFAIDVSPELALARHPAWILGAASVLLALCGVMNNSFAMHRKLNFLLVLTLMLIEAYLSWRGYVGFVQFYFLIPIFIIFASLLSGMVLGSVVAISATLVSYSLIKLPRDSNALFSSRDVSEALSYLAYFVVAQVIVVVLVYFFDRSLERDKKDLHERRLERAKSTRRLVLADTIGKAAHELNNPIAMLHGSIQLLSIRPGDLAVRKTIHSAIVSAEERLGAVIDSIRKFSKGDLEEARFIVRTSDLLEDFLAQSQLILQSHQAEIECFNHAPKSTIYCRSNQILFILSVLLENALEASAGGSRGSKVNLRLSIEQIDHKIRFELEDEGRGISDLDADRIFNPFHSTKPSGQTLGMNLSLCRVFIDEQGGSIGFQRLSRGTLFWFELPEHLN